MEVRQVGDMGKRTKGRRGADRCRSSKKGKREEQEQGKGKHYRMVGAQTFPGGSRIPRGREGCLWLALLRGWSILLLGLGQGPWAMVPEQPSAITGDPVPRLSTCGDVGEVEEGLSEGLV